MTFSEIEYKKNGVKWILNDSELLYSRNEIPKNASSTIASLGEEQMVETYFTIRFSYVFKHSSDKVYFAYAKPYTITRYLAMLCDIKQELAKNAHSINVLNEHELKANIEEFIAKDNFSPDMTKKCTLDEDQIHQKSLKRKLLLYSDQNFIKPEILEEYIERYKEKEFNIFNSEDIQRVSAN